MSESLNFDVESFEPPAIFQDQLDALPKEKFPEDPVLIFEQAMGVIFDTEFPVCMGEFIGSRPEAVAAVQYGLSNSLLEHAVCVDPPLDGPSHVISPVSEYFEQPDPVIVSAMQRRTDYIKELFMIEELERVQAQVPDTGDKCVIPLPYILDTFTKLERSESENKKHDQQTTPGLRSSYSLGLVSEGRRAGNRSGGLPLLRDT